MYFFPIARRVLNSMEPHSNFGYIIIDEHNETMPFQHYAELPHVLTLTFDDIEKVIDKEDILFTEHMAEYIISFVQNMIDIGIKDIWISCDGGISRSTAVAIALTTLFNQPPEDEVESHMRLYPYYNRYVYNMMITIGKRYGMVPFTKTSRRY